MAVALDDHQLFHIDRSEIANAPEIIAGKVYQHDMLGAFFGIGEQLELEGLILLTIGPTAPRAGDGANLDLSVFAAHMDFRRGPDERKAFQLEQEHVWRRIDGARRAI